MEHPFQYFALAAMRDIKQYSCVDYYYSYFEFLRAFCLNRFPAICDAYFLSQFIHGLKKEIQVYVLQHHPVHLLDAYELACISEYYCAHPTTSMCIDNSTNSPTVDVSVSSFPLTLITEPIISYAEVPLCFAISSKLQDDVDELSHNTKDISSNGESDLLNSETPIVLLPVPCKEICSLFPSTVGSMITKVTSKGDDTNYVLHEPAAICNIKVDGHPTLDKGGTDSISFLTSPCLLSQPLVYLCEEMNVTSCLYTQCLLSLQVHNEYGISLVLSAAIPIGSTRILSFKVSRLYDGPSGTAATLRDNGGHEKSLGGLPLLFLEWCRAISDMELAIVFSYVQGSFNASHDDITAIQGTTSSNVVNTLSSIHVACSPVGCTDTFWPINVDLKSDGVIQEGFLCSNCDVQKLMFVVLIRGYVSYTSGGQISSPVSNGITIIRDKGGTSFIGFPKVCLWYFTPRTLSSNVTACNSIQDIRHLAYHSNTSICDLATSVVNQRHTFQLDSVMQHFFCWLGFCTSMLSNYIGDIMIRQLSMEIRDVVYAQVLEDVVEQKWSSDFVAAIGCALAVCVPNFLIVECSDVHNGSTHLVLDMLTPVSILELSNTISKCVLWKLTVANSTVMDNETVTEYFCGHILLSGFRAATRYLIILGTTLSVKDGKHRSVCKHPPLLAEELFGAISEEPIPLWIATAEAIFAPTQHHAIIASLRISLGVFCGTIWWLGIYWLHLSQTHYPLVRRKDGLLGALAATLQMFFLVAASFGLLRLLHWSKLLYFQFNEVSAQHLYIVPVLQAIVLQFFVVFKAAVLHQLVGVFLTSSHAFAKDHSVVHPLYIGFYSHAIWVLDSKQCDECIIALGWFLELYEVPAVETLEAVHGELSSVTVSRYGGDIQCTPGDPSLVHSFASICYQLTALGSFPMSGQAISWGTLQLGNLANMSKLVESSWDHCVIWCLIVQNGMFVVLRDNIATLSLTTSPAVSACNCKQRLQEVGLNSYMHAWNMVPPVDKNASKLPVPYIIERTFVVLPNVYPYL